MKAIATLLLLITSATPCLADIAKHNPGNLVKTESLWEGQIKSKGRFVAFKDRHYGLRALAIVLLRYERRHGLTTVQQVVNRFAPAHENNSKRYAEFVADELGVSVTANINICAYGTEIMKAIILMENGCQPYSDDEIYAAMVAGINYVHENP
jgi:hypothetical protein